ncbi:fungal-specific transcription factor domain-domain-containing protein [Clohesyomyces aquaticus]|uniref:Fungal-specific transcription factor domain-domain-containing protein n=1 Tax=Clohesyomyces aquaticus TaxID=1231657 RepID=A0A1Y1Z9D2_9PLEO|nr:fungal-specific transcription factor domain-domain-containing protein [Clohesyomyces aquaticus]
MSDDMDMLSPQTSQDRIQKSKTGSISGVSGAGSLNPRSCVTCRKRKVKCDKKQPCSNCSRAKIECIFPGPGRAPRKSRKPPDGELMDRLRRLEGVVKTLNAQVEEHEQEKEGAERSKKDGGDASMCPNGGGAGGGVNVAVDNSVEGLESRFGRLVVDQGRSRYINNSFWASLNNEVEDLKAILIEPSDDEDDTKDSPASSDYTSQHQTFMFAYSSSAVDMMALHPTPGRALEFWDIYKENVDPLVKVLHIPSIEPVILDAITHLDKIPKGLECLLFAIYYGAVTSIMPLECQEKWGEERESILQKYRFGLEQALARANFLYCDETVILQAFVIFLILLRRNDDARKIWTLTGLVVRIAQTLGIHRDGSHFGLPPFEIEMRRRLWWQVCILDARASEDHGCDPTIVEAQFDTKMPLNVNDSDLDPNMTDFPTERVGFTDMTFCIIRFEVANIFRRILYIPPGTNRCNQYFANLSIPEKEKWISDCHQRLEDKYLKDCDMSNPLCWVTATVSRLVMSKMWLIVYHPHQRRDGGASLPQETKDKLFITSLENIEYSILLETEARTMKWGWLFRTYVQWHAIAFLLSELCVRTKGEAVERAWRALETTAGRWWFPLADGSNYRKGKQGCLWKPLRKLMAKARAARERELTLERASQALRAGGVTYQDFPKFLDQLEPVSPNQPSSDDLDKLLRPSAPRLGDMPVAKPPSWAGSPRGGEVEDDVLHTVMVASETQVVGVGLNINGSTPSSTNDHTHTPTSSNSAQQFQEITDYGLEYLMRDIWHGHSLSGDPIPSDPNSTSGFTMPQSLVDSSTQLPANGINGLANGFNPNPGPLPTANFNDSPTSPLLDAGQMDWANWDDLVREYGTENGQKQLVTASNGDVGPGHLGMMNWF